MTNQDPPVIKQTFDYGQRRWGYLCRICGASHGFDSEVERNVAEQTHDEAHTAAKVTKGLRSIFEDD